MANEASLYDESFFDEESANSAKVARKIIPLVKEVVSVGSVLDVGCGVGMFLRQWMAEGVADVIGIDGAYVAPEKLGIPQEKFHPHDLKESFRLNRKFDLVMSLEVAEHLPAFGANAFVESLCAHGDVILFSAAIPGQGGVNHVNEQWPDYWSAKFAARGYRCIDSLRPLVWNDPDVDYWYSQNTLFYANEAGLAANPKLVAALAQNAPGTPHRLVHPGLYQMHMGELLGNRRVLAALQGFLQTLNQLSRGS